MTMKSHQEKSIDWSISDDRVRELGFKDFKAWCLHHGFSHKTGYALRKGQITWGYGPKVRAILQQALRDGVAVEDDDEAGGTVHDATVTERRHQEN